MKHILLLLFILLVSCTKDDDFDAIGTTEEFVLKSSIINDAYPIFVYLPPNYSAESTNQLVIGLDGDSRFKTIASLISDKVKNGSMPSSIFIGIGNSKERNRDYTPTVYDKGSGGADNFYLFLKNELIPELESRYNIDTSHNKTLIGNSFGGLFAQYVMAKERTSNPFDKFIAIGTSYWYDSGIIFEYEKSYAENNTDLPITFFNGMGTLEGGVSLASFEEMNIKLDNRSFPGFKHKSEYIKASGHSGAVNEGFKKGLDYVFSK
jgi:predicted alpha/beta superfamily hydrolase